MDNRETLSRKTTRYCYAKCLNNRKTNTDFFLTHVRPKILFVCVFIHMGIPTLERAPQDRWRR